jgi:arsenate reductase-like glutaredoxin family protein
MNNLIFVFTRRHVQDILQREGIVMNAVDIRKNPVQRTIAKLFLNSFNLCFTRRHVQDILQREGIFMNPADIEKNPVQVHMVKNIKHHPHRAIGLILLLN